MRSSSYITRKFQASDYYTIEVSSGLREIPKLVSQLTVELNISLNAASSIRMKQFIAKILRKGLHLLNKTLILKRKAFHQFDIHVRKLDR